MNCRWFCARVTTAAEQGNADAQVELGFIYDLGLGISQDDQEVLKSYRKAAEQGLAEAQVNLGVMYRHGEGVPRDFIRAHMWYSVAAASTSGDDGKIAVKNRDNLASQMTAAQIAQAQEMARCCQGTKFKECD